MANKLWKIIKLLISLLVIVFFIYYFINNKENFKIVFSVSASTLLLIFTLYSIHFFLNGLFILNILRSFKHKISNCESFYISVFSSFGNYFLPMQGGAVIRSVYLKNTLNFPFSLFISTLYGNYVIIFLVTSIFGLVSLIILDINNSTVPFPAYFFFGGLFLSMLLLIIARFKNFPEKINGFVFINNILRIFKNIIKGWQILSKNKKLLLKLGAIATINFLVMSTIYYLEFNALRIDSSTTKIILYNSLSGASLLISITPGSLGIREGLFFLTSNILEISNNQIMILSLLDRGITLFTLFFWFIALSFWKHLSNFIFKKTT